MWSPSFLYLDRAGANDGPQHGITAHEKSYAAVKVSEANWAISYLAASGYTLTVVLNLDSGQMFGFASNDKEWYPMKGTFKIVRPAI